MMTLLSASEIAVGESVQVDEAGPLLLTTKEAAAAMAISVSMLETLTASGKVPCVRLPTGPTAKRSASAVRYCPRELLGADGPLLRPEEAAAALAMSPRKLWALTKDGTIQCRRLGEKCVRYTRAALRAFVEQRKDAR